MHEARRVRTAGQFRTGSTHIEASGQWAQVEEDIGVHDRIYGIEGEPFADQEALLERVRELIDSGAETITFEVETAGRLRPVEVDLSLPGADRDDPSL